LAPRADVSVLPSVATERALGGDVTDVGGGWWC